MKKVYKIDSEEKLNELCDFLEVEFDDKIQFLIGGIITQYVKSCVDDKFDYISYDSIQKGIHRYIRDFVCWDYIGNISLSNWEFNNRINK